MTRPGRLASNGTPLSTVRSNAFRDLPPWRTLS